MFLCILSALLAQRHTNTHSCAMPTSAHLLSNTYSVVGTSNVWLDNSVFLPVVINDKKSVWCYLLFFGVKGVRC